ncbi:50S ribosomal protein L31 [Nocardioides eburneiflavus]|uniref:50S ribosomal protein L31 n=1 Tax=Nocardioides eburneiflavus TaxID=2518372 RepID=A0A4Z1CE30_9ACTN|nr:50S ribosomal protein L31 [Nocardioides eburneiflavus]
MKQGIHPDYGPVVAVDITSDSHPFWTGTARRLDSEGRVEKFQRRYGGSR